MQHYLSMADEVLNGLKLEATSFSEYENVKKYAGKNGLRKETFSINNNDSNFLKAGNYSVVSFENIMIATPKMINYLVNHLALELGKFLGKLTPSSKVLIVALGNKNISADSLGYNTIKNILVTSLYNNISFFEGVPKTYAISTSVLGLTGIESSDIVKGVVDNVKPDKIIVIDTLCTTSYKRLGTSFQINNAGIVPGSGINNTRKELNAKNLHVPVISVGVPLVMFAYSLIDEALENAFENYFKQDESEQDESEQDESEQDENRIDESEQDESEQDENRIDESEKNKSEEDDKINGFIKQLSKENFNNLIVAPKDVEEIVKVCGQVVAMAINKAVTGFSVEKQKQIIYRL